VKTGINGNQINIFEPVFSDGKFVVIK